MIGAFAAGSRPAVAAPAGDALPTPRDLRRDIDAAAARGQPLVLMVTLAGCPYCDIVRRSYLRPLAAAGVVPVVQIDLRARGELRGPGGQSTSEADLARQWKATMAPTVLFLGPGGVEVAPRLTGFSADFYAAYLDDALAQSRARLDAARR